MQPVRLTIPGDFWDSQIYRGRLYLTAMDGSLFVYDWDALVESLIRTPHDRLAVTCALSLGDYLYGDRWALVFDDPNIKEILSAKFEKIATVPIELNADQLEQTCLGVTDSPWGLADDADLYRNHLYAVTDTGVFATDIRRPARRHDKSGVGRAKKIWDGGGLSVSVRRGGDLAVAAGTEGLFEIGPLFEDHDREREARQISSRHTLLVSYAYASIYGSSDRTGGYLAAYGWQEDDEGRRFRRHVRTFDSADIFGHNGGASWANQEKIYLSSPGRLDVVRYVQSNVVFDERDNPGRAPFERLGSLDLPRRDGQVMGGAVALFGTVVEYDGGLAVLQSDHKTYQISGPVTRWRVFPRSRRYENHLHVILEDRLDIYSFNHDYFVDQHTKLAGIEYRVDEFRSGESKTHRLA